MNDGNIVKKYSEDIQYKPAQSVWILLKPGVIKKIIGLESVKKNKGVLRVLQRLHEGNTVTESMFETEKSALCRVWITADSDDELELLSRKVREMINVVDDGGKSLIWNGLNL